MLVTGGIGVDGNYVSFASTELYNPSKGNWILSGNMSVGRTGHSATLLETGEVLVAGGSGYYVNCCATAELCNPSTGSVDAHRQHDSATVSAWSETGEMHYGRFPTR